MSAVTDRQGRARTATTNYPVPGPGPALARECAEGSRPLSASFELTCLREELVRGHADDLRLTRIELGSASTTPIDVRRLLFSLADALPLVPPRGGRRFPLLGMLREPCGQQLLGYAPVDDVARAPRKCRAEQARGVETPQACAARGPISHTEDILPLRTGAGEGYVGRRDRPFRASRAFRAAKRERGKTRLWLD